MSSSPGIHKGDASLHNSVGADNLEKYVENSLHPNDGDDQVVQGLVKEDNLVDGKTNEQNVKNNLEPPGHLYVKSPVVKDNDLVAKNVESSAENNLDPQQRVVPDLVKDNSACNNNIKANDLSGERLKLDGERLKLDGERLKLDGEHLKLDGEHLKLDGEHLKLDGERLKLDGEVKEEECDDDDDDDDLVIVEASGSGVSTRDSKNDIKPPLDKMNHEQVLMNEYGADNNKETKSANIEKLLHKIEQLKENLRCDEATLSMLKKLFNSQRGGVGAGAGGANNNQKQPSMQHQVQQHKQGYKIVQNPSPSLQQQGGRHQQQPQVRSPVTLSPRLPNSPRAPNAPLRYRQEVVNPTNSAPNVSQSHRAPHVEKFVPIKQTNEQKQLALKEALRKQLQQTLQEIQPPSPPNVDWKVIPSVGSMDFITLVGLDEVVDNILDMSGRPKIKSALKELVPSSNSCICSQCKIDFSHSWKYNDDSKVSCNRCASQDSKTAMKSKYVSRLKAVFSKALKQEQEIEEKMKSGEEFHLVSEINSKNNPSPTTESKNAIRGGGGGKGVKIIHSYPAPPHNNQMKQRYSYPSHASRPSYRQHKPRAPPPQVQNSTRWHPYHNAPPPGHFSEHHKIRHVGYIGSPRSPGYYVVHKPQPDKAV